MIQRLLLLFVSLAVVSNYAHGLGLGKLDLQSALNQEFRAEIELTNTAGLSDEEILPNLASQADFARVGVERTYLLTDLRFRVGTNDEGKTVVLISSSKPIIEPFLNFLVEVIWPNGRILREYTVLLDPPRFGNAGVAPLATAQSASSAQSSAQSSTPAQQSSGRSNSTSPTNIPAPSGKPAPSTDEGEVVNGEYGVTGPGDTLWKIAARVRPDNSVSIQQTMLALQRANPNAFINNNINLLKAGYVLRVPDADEILSEGRDNAVAEVQVQNDEFADYRSGGLAQLDATRRPARDNRPAPEQEDGELKLLASNSNTGRRAGGSSGAASAAVENDLASAREDLDRARRASSEMQIRLDDLQEQIETLNELVKLKDDQLAALRSELQKQQGAEPAAPAATPATTTTAASGSLLTNPMVLGGVLLLLVGLVIGGMVFYRRRQQAELDEDDGLEVDLPELSDDADSVDDSIDIQEELVGIEEDEELAPQTSDVISEAEIYIAYGRFPQAITFLQNAIEAEPDRADIQLKLLEVFVQTEDATAFNLQLEQMQMLGDEDANARAAEMQRQIPGAAEAAGIVLDDEPEESLSLGDDDDEDMSFDLDDLDAETDDDELSLDLEDDEGATLVLDTDDGGELDLGEELDLGDELDLDLDDDAETAVLEDDGLDLDLEDDDDDDVTQIRPRATPAADDDDLGLDLDDSDELSLDLDDDGLDLDLDLDDGDSLDLDLDDGDSLDLDLDDGDSLDLDLDDGDSLDLDLDDSDSLDLDLDEGDEINLELDDGDALDLDLDDGDDELDLGGDDELSIDEDLDLDLGDDDELSLDLADDDDALDLDSLAVNENSEDDVFELDLDADDDDLDLDLGDDSLALDEDLDEDLDDELSLDLDDDDLGELDLDDDASSKLDLARAYIDMGDQDGAKELLQEVLKVGTEGDIQEANDLLAKLD